MLKPSFKSRIKRYLASYFTFQMANNKDADQTDQLIAVCTFVVRKQ